MTFTSGLVARPREIVCGSLKGRLRKPTDFKRVRLEAVTVTYRLRAQAAMLLASRIVRSICS